MIIMNKELLSRKKMRLIGHDYSGVGAYFVTLCAKDRHELLGEIIVGDAPLRVPQVRLSEYGIFVDAQIQKTSHIYPHVLIGNYVIMPNHVHMIAILKDRSGGGVADEPSRGVVGGPRRGAAPTKAVIPQIVQSLKSMTTKQFGFNMWQRSYHDHIIRDQADYQRIWQYIDENPIRWAEDCYYTV